MSQTMPNQSAKCLRWRLRQDEGQNLVEYAFVLIISLLMMFGIVEFSRALYAYHFVDHAARETARWAMVNGSDCTGDGSCGAPASASDIQAYVTSIAPPGIDTGSDCGGACLTATATWEAPPGAVATTCAAPLNSPGCVVQVQVSYKFKFVIPIISTAAVTMSSSSEMVIAH